MSQSGSVSESCQDVGSARSWGWIEKPFRGLLASAGITINGTAPSDIQVRDRRLFKKVLLQGSLGLGESYMDGWWDCERLDEFICRLLNAMAATKERLQWPKVFLSALGALTNRQSARRAFQVGERHYDLDNDLFEAMLDKRMVYTCAYWKNAANLDKAQEAKLDLVCRKLGLRPGHRVLDIGCGWGSFAKYAAEHYGVSVVGITVSREQVELGRKMCAGLPVDIRLMDYRDCDERFDRIVSLGMFEHVGYKNYRRYMSVARKCLAEGGLFLLHTIGMMTSSRSGDPWIERYIFPNTMLPSARQVTEAIDSLFQPVDWHSFGLYYDKTLLAWHENVERHWSDLSRRYDERFHRMWRYYLLMCAGLFRSGQTTVWQIMLSPGAVDPGICFAR